MTKDREDEERQIAERLRKAVYDLDTCDYCNYVIESVKAYEQHLATEHPEGE